MTTAAPHNPMPGSAPSPQMDPSSAQPLSWEGDRMFNIYIYDYCYKRGYRKTARELLAEAEIPPESQPPINARQGLLFEWWSVFWVLFTAKASGTGPDEAMVYIQHQATQAANRQRQPPPQPTPGGQPNQPPGQGIRPVNGMQPNPAIRGGFMPNGPMNGTLPSNSFGIGPSAPHMNGLPSASATPGPSQVQPPFQAMVPGQRPPPGMAGQRGSGPPFQSPTMDLHNAGGGMPGGPGGQPQSTQHPHQQPPPGMPGMQPSFSRASMPGMQMQPPNGMQMNPSPNPNPGQQGGPGQQQQQQAFQQLGRPPSRTATPGQMMSHQQSPSLLSRTAPIMGGGGGPSQQELQISADLAKIPGPLLQQLKAEAGLDGKDINLMNFEEKQRIMSVHRAKAQQQQQQRGKQPGQNNNPTPGPSNQMIPPAQRTVPPRNAKRNSTSPGEEPDMTPASGSSPPDRKRPRRSPMEQPPMTPMPGMSYPQGGPPSQPQQPSHQQQGQQQGQPGPGPGPGGPGGQHPGQPQMMRGMQGQNGGFPMPGGMSMMPMGGPPGGPGGMSMPGMGMSPMAGMNQMGGGQMQMQMGNMGRGDHYRAPQFHMQTRGAQMNNPMPMMNASSPGSDPNSFNPGGGPGSQPQFNSPGMNPMPNTGRQGKGGMAPPPSPGMSGGNKDQQQNGNGKDSKPDGSPHTGTINSSGQTPTATGTSPPTPNPSQQNQPPPPMQSLVPSPTSMMGGSMNNPPDVFPGDFIAGIASSLDDFDPTMFRGDPSGDINFERDFGQWFSPDVNDIVNPLDMK